MTVIEHTHTHELPPPAVEDVADGVYAYIQADGTWFINNCGFVAGHDQTLLIDATSTEARTRALIRAIEDTSGTPVRTLVNTHHHADHTHGNYLFTEATIVAHRNCRTTMLAAGMPDYSATFPGVDWGELEFRAPDLTFDGGLDLHVGATVIQLQDLGYVAHTEGDIVAWLPEQRVLFSGDLVFHGGTPFALFGSVQGTIDAMDRLESYGADVLVPGHGPVARGPAEIGAAITDQREYLTFIQQQAGDGIAAGRTPLEQARTTELGRFAGWSDGERLVGNLHVAYREAGANPDFAIPHAIGEMVTYNGGALPRCLA
ncbi:MAG: MBL fold metallo-hydrolase [Actinomycetota bacterium]